MNVEREVHAAEALPVLVARREAVLQALARVAQARDPGARKEAALRIGLEIPEIRAIGSLLEMQQENTGLAANFLAIGVEGEADRAFLQGLVDRLLVDSDVLLALRDVMPGSFPAPAQSPLQPFKARLRLLADALEPAYRWLHELGYVEQARLLRNLIDACRSFAFRVYVIGEWSSGKSTLINALLGQDLLPTGYVPVTPAPTRIRYGARTRLFLKRRDEPDESEHPPELLRDLCLPGASQEMAAENARLLNLEYLRVELPAPLCQDGIELVDTPGLNDAGQQAQLVAELLPGADAVLLVLRANQPLTAVELEVLRQGRLQPEGLRRWLDAGFVAFTFTDVVLRDRRSKEAIETLKRRVAGLLRELHPPLGFAPERQFWIDAHGALLAKLEQNSAEDACLKDFHRLEQSLEAFLAQERGPQLEGGRREEAIARVRWGVRLLEAEQQSIKTGQRLNAEECQSLEHRIHDIGKRGQELAVEMAQKAKKFATERGQLLVAYVQGLQPALIEHIQGVSYEGKVLLSPHKAAEHFAAVGQDWLTQRISDWSKEDLYPNMEHFLRPFIEDFDKLRKETEAIGARLLLPESLLGEAVISKAVEGAMATTRFLYAGAAMVSVGLSIMASTLLPLLPAAIPVVLVAGVTVAVLGYLGFTSIGEEGRQSKLRQAVVDELLKHLTSTGQTERFVRQIEGYFIKIAEAMHAVTAQSVRELKEQLSLQRQVAALEDERRELRLTNLSSAIAVCNGVLDWLHAPA